MFILSQGYMPRELQQIALRNLEPFPLIAQVSSPAYQRTGSNLLCGRLHSHHEILMHSELFNEAKIYSHDPTLQIGDDLFSKKWSVFHRDLDPSAFLSELLSRPTFDHHLLVGFKLFPEHWRESNMILMQQLLADPRVKKIILRRDNLLDLYTSKLRADKSGAYVKEILDDIDITIDPAAFQLFIDHYDACYKTYEEPLLPSRYHLPAAVLPPLIPRVNPRVRA